MFSAGGAPLRYEILIDVGLRVSVHIERRRRSLTFFAVCLEILLDDDRWHAVVRYDNEGGTVHRDRLHRDGSYRNHRETVRVPSGLGEAVNFAKSDLIDRAGFYVEDFLRDS